MNLCRDCGEDFGSVSAFDAHRVGGHEHAFSAKHPTGRRCLSFDELRRLGWTQDGRNRWRRPSEGAPWARSETQVTALAARGRLSKDEAHIHRLGGRARLPEAGTRSGRDG
jgi:hypothetical protein